MKGKLFLVILIVGIFTVFSQPVSADLIINLDREYSGADLPSGSGPWLTATFENNGDDTVRLTMDAIKLNQASSDEFVGAWYFNIDTDFINENLSITHFSGAAGTVIIDQDSLKADGDGYFDFLFGWKANDFTTGTVIYDIYASGLTANDFNYLSKGAGNSPDGLYTAAHVQGLASGGSGWLTGPVVPIPGAVWLLGSGLIGMFGIRRKFKN